jgi:hypothetical protein
MAVKPQAAQQPVADYQQELRRSVKNPLWRNLKVKRISDAHNDTETCTDVDCIDNRSVSQPFLPENNYILRIDAAWLEYKLFKETDGCPQFPLYWSRPPVIENSLCHIIPEFCRRDRAMSTRSKPALV